MRLKISGDRNEVRQSYIPALSLKLTTPLVVRGKEAVSEVIDFMDEYYLSKEEYDMILELGVGKHAEKLLNAQIPSAVKSDLTRRYDFT